MKTWLWTQAWRKVAMKSSYQASDLFCVMSARSIFMEQRMQLETMCLQPHSYLGDLLAWWFGTWVCLMWHCSCVWCTLFPWWELLSPLAKDLWWQKSLHWLRSWFPSYMPLAMLSGLWHPVCTWLSACPWEEAWREWGHSWCSQLPMSAQWHMLEWIKDWRWNLQVLCNPSLIEND